MLTNRQLAFLAAYAEGGSIKDAARQSGIKVSEHLTWLSVGVTTGNLEYNEAFAQAEAESTIALEDEAVRRAMVGNKKIVRGAGGKQLMEPVKDDDGNVVMGPDDQPLMQPVYEYNASDSLLMFLLTGRSPKFKKRVENTLTGPNGGPITSSNVDLSLLPPEDLLAMEALLNKAQIVKRVPYKQIGPGEVSGIEIPIDAVRVEN